MARYKMLVLSRSSEDQEAEYNEWYQNTHIQQIVTLPGFVSAQRYKLAVDMLDGAWPYMAIYEIEADDVEAAYQALQSAAGDGSIVMSPSLDLDTVYASIYEPFGEAARESGS